MGVNIHQAEDHILICFLSRDACARFFLENIRAGEKCCVKIFLISGKGTPLNHCGLETHKIKKWDPPTLAEVFLIPESGDSIFINPFLLKIELSSDIVSDL